MQIVQNKFNEIEVLSDDKKNDKFIDSDFLLELCRNCRGRGGGSVAALSGSLGASLSSMVASLTHEKKEMLEYIFDMEKKTEDIRGLEISKDSTNMPVYMLTINGNRRTGVVRCDGKIIRSLNGRIVDISNDDELIGTFSFHQELWDAMCTNFVMNNIASRLRKESN